MKRMNILIVSLMLSIVLFGAIRFANCTSPTVYLNPSNKEVAVGEEFDINIYVDYVSHLYGYEVWLTYDKNKLNASSINNGGFLNEPTNIWYQEVNNTAGYVTLAVSSQFPATGTTGGSPPSLATIHFKALASGSSPIQFITNKTILSNDQGIEVAHTTVDGTVHISSGTTHDVAVTNLKTCKDGCMPFPTVGQNYTMHVNVTVENQGNFTETFAVTVYANATVINQTLLILPNATSITFSFSWNATAPYGNVTISAVADIVPGETDTIDNTHVGSTILVTIPGDVNGEFKVRPQSLNTLLVAYGSPTNPERHYNPNCDLDDNHKVGPIDLNILLVHFGWHYP